MNKYGLGLLLVCSAALVACGKSEAPATTAAPVAAPVVVAAAAAPAPESENAVGKSVFGRVCAMCHASGAAGAPKPGNKDEWGPRIAQGKDVLYKHALEGFNGTKGAMPARGANASLTDAEVKAAVDYMVSLSK
ncbi:MAG: c-type cytochrome [Rhodoferax sp.]|jgi:cytochrome c5